MIPPQNQSKCKFVHSSFSLLFSRSREGTTASGISTLTFSTNDSHTETVLLDISKEKRNQRFLIMVNIIYFVSLLPVNVLK